MAARSRSSSWKLHQPGYRVHRHNKNWREQDEVWWPLPSSSSLENVAAETAEWRRRSLSRKCKKAFQPWFLWFAKHPEKIQCSLFLQGVAMALCHRCSQSPTLCVPICVTQGRVPICVTPFVSPTHSVCHHLAAPFCAAVCVQIFLGVSIAATFRVFHKCHTHLHLFLIRKDNHQN